MKKDPINAIENEFNCWCKFKCSVQDIVDSKSQYTFIETTECKF